MSEFGEGRGCLFGVSAAVAAVCGALAYRSLTPFPILWAIGSGLAYVLLAAIAVIVCEGLRRWAWGDEWRRWDREKRAYVGAFWPLSLAFWLVVSLFYKIINLAFPGRSN